MTTMTKSEVLDAIIRRSSLAGADLSMRDLEGVAFDGISLRNADLSGCDLTRADLRHCDLSGANLTQTCLGNAELGGAHMLNTILADADIDMARGLEHASRVIDAGIDSRGYRFIGVWHSDRGWMVKAGCRWFTMARAEEHWAGKENNDALARLNVIKATVFQIEPPAGFTEDETF